MSQNNHYLIIEDDHIDKMIAERMIERIHPEIEQRGTSDGEEAISYLRKCLEGNNVPRFILVDLIMPLSDGFQFLERYNSELYPKMPEVPVLILSSSIHERDKKKCLGYPFVKEYMLKPFDSKLFKELEII